jgi:hypothetical protein
MSQQADKQSNFEGYVPGMSPDWWVEYCEVDYSRTDFTDYDKGVISMFFLSNTKLYVVVCNGLRLAIFNNLEEAHRMARWVGGEVR